ncbi:hypothetical protein EV183_005164, partial [Coemansia sp. RSA 2336]
MWSQLALIVSAFALGYYVATRKPATARAALPAEPAISASMAGAFPESADRASKETEKGPSRHRNAKAKRKRAAKSKQAPSPEPAKPALPQAIDPEPPKSDSATDNAPQAESKAAVEPQSQKDEWQAVGASGAKPPTKQSNPIPIHSTEWSAVANDVDLSEDETKQPPQHRVM